MDTSHLGKRPIGYRDDSLIQAFARNMKRRRRHLGLSQAELAFMSHLHPAQISNMERCVTNPTLESINAVALALSVEPMFLLDRGVYKVGSISKEIKKIRDGGS